jgi:ABC-2 type transport system ATP-binding protein
MTLAIEISRLTKIFRGKRGARVAALQDLSLEIGEGEVFGFLGPNGAGKSTTIKALMGLITPTSGEARILGVAASNSQARRQVGYLPENPAFYDYLGAEEYLALVGRIYRMEAEAMRRSSEAVLRRLDLWEARKRPMRGYSKGMVQRVGLAQVLLHDPQVCILDEPMSGLDPLGRALVKELILELKAQGKCVFFSTHITSDVEEVCDRVGVIVQGRLQRVEAVATIHRQGIVDYRLLLKGHQGVGEEELLVPCAELTILLTKLEAEGREIVLVEPRRKTLEKFFLDIDHASTP